MIFFKQKSEQGKNDIQLIYGLANLQNTSLRWLDEDSSAIKTRPINNNDRLRFIKAIVNGYEIEEEQKCFLPMEGTNNGKLGDEYICYARQQDNGRWCIAWAPAEISQLVDELLWVTRSQIDSAPAWVKAITPVPVDDPDYGIGINS